MCGNRWHCVFFAVLHCTLCRQNGVCQRRRTTEADGKVVGNAWQSISTLSLPAKYWQSCPPEFVVVIDQPVNAQGKTAGDPKREVLLL